VLPQELEDPAVEIAMPPGIVVHGRAIEPVDDGHQPLRDVVTHERLDDDPLRLQLATLAAHLVAALAAQALQVVVERPEPRILPVVLVAGAPEPPARGEHRPVVIETEVHVGD
jgi:hypothetical protein